MNVLMIHPHDLFACAEPWTIRIINIAKEFVKLNHKVRLCYFPLSFGEKNTKKIDSIEIFPLERRPTPISFLRNVKKLIELAKWADVIHFQKCHHYSAIPAVLAAYITGKPLHYDWDDWEEKIWYESCGKSLHSRFIGVSFKILERWLPVLADSVSCSSNYLKKIAYKYGVKKEYIFDSPVGADLEKFRPDLNGSWVREKYDIKEHLVLYIGQLHGAQYVDLFIKAANIVLHEKPNATFMIVGEGFLRRKLERLVQDLGIENKVIFTGAVPHKEIPYYICAADICVASFKKTEVTQCKSPLKIVEYLACGKPVVASLVGEVRSMVGGVGVLVEPGNHLNLAKAIIFLLENEEIRKELGKRARKRVEYKYNWNFTAKSILSAYEKILNDP